MSKMGQTVFAIQEYVTANQNNFTDSSQVHQDVTMVFGPMFADIAVEYYQTMHLPEYDEMNDYTEYENLLSDLGLEA